MTEHIRTAMRLGLAALGLVAVVGASPALAVPIPLGAFIFDSTKFGNTLAQSDGGTFAASDWLNVVNADPGSPAYLTGANFDTGIANIGLAGADMPVYTIGYGSAISNGPGADLGVVTARFSTNDTITLAVSTNGATFTPTIAFGPGLAVATGVPRTYFHGGINPSGAELFVTSIDLSAFGLAPGATIVAVQITGSPELDLIRVAGFGGGTTVPEPMTLALLGPALAVLGLIRRRGQAEASRPY